MSQPRNERKRRAQQLRTRRHEAKRRAVRNAYRPRTTRGRLDSAMDTSALVGHPLLNFVSRRR